MLLTGSLSGLISVLAQTVIWSIVEALAPRARATQMAQLDVPDILLHMLTGAGLGLLFWLSWGLTAIVDVPWWHRGLVFGGVNWLVLVAPTVISVARYRETGLQVGTVLAARWMTTCLIAGLACAWNWQRGM